MTTTRALAVAAPASHTVTALCLSEKARGALFERIQDGTFPDAARMAKAGAWRLTLADALDCRNIGSLRFVGLPRKPYTRRRTPSPVATRVPSGFYHAAPQL